ncbi:hypothetical protein NDU88_007526 [Pleurodeles waltl]|uniref:Uncharacterized protein n=1 Tax=Pleurodeles waltl TaxID=8319 RepID=A0AAV7VUQ3_PLEWA|nr:hypothetical protein NDU88_007526 [Pleurodeles waltl]
MKGKARGVMAEDDTEGPLGTEGAGASLATHIAAILVAIKDSKLTLEEWISEVVNEVGLLCEDQKKLAAQVKKIELKPVTIH